MHLFANFVQSGSVAQAILVISLAAVLGLALGHIRFGAIRFGVAGVIFSSLLLSHFGMRVDHEILEFCRELGLMLFVYLTGLQVGPGFFSSLKRHGLKFNIFALFIVLGGTLTAAAIGRYFFSAKEFPLAVGLLSGATTNTPSLGAAHQAMLESGLGDLTHLVGVGYAIAYPFGVLGIILTILLLKKLMKVDLSQEIKSFESAWAPGQKELFKRHIRLVNKNIEGRTLAEVLGYLREPVTVSRIMKDGEVKLAAPQTPLSQGDVLLAVGTEKGLNAFQSVVGEVSADDLINLPSKLDSRQCLITEQKVVGKTLADINLRGRLSVNATRLIRSGVEITPSGSTRLQFGDTLRIVGEKDLLSTAAKELGDSRHALDSPRLVPMFLGLALGILLGSIPIDVIGMPVPIKLGLAGGPLLTAIILSRIGRIGPMIWHMPENANRTLREFGIVLFLVCVGLKAGEGFFEVLFTASGLSYLAMGAAITLIPLVAIGLVALIFFKENYLAVCGLLAGSMTDPPALAFASGLGNSQAAAVTYATVYPLAMIGRIISAQILVLFFM